MWRGLPSLRSGAGWLRAGTKQAHRGLNASRLVRHPGVPKPHLDTGERATQHQVVEVTEMADPEDTIGDFRKSIAKREIVVFERDTAEVISGMPVGHYHCRQDARVGGRVQTQDFEPPGLDGGPGCRRMSLVAVEYGLKALFT